MILSRRKNIVFIFIVFILTGNYGLSQEEIHHIIPPLPPSESQVDEIFSLTDWRDYPLAKDCKRNKNVEIMYFCLEEKLSLYIRDQFKFPLVLKGIKYKERVCIEYDLEKSIRIRDIKISSVSNPKIKDELLRVLNRLNANVKNIIHPKKAKSKLYKIKIEHVLEIDERLLKQK